MLLRYSDCACPARIASGMIGERASLTKGELESCTRIDWTAVKHPRCVGRDRMRGSVIVCPRDGCACLHLQRIGLESSTGDGHRVAGRSYNSPRRRSLGRRRSVRGLNVLGLSSSGTRRRLAA